MLTEYRFKASDKISLYSDALVRKLVECIRVISAETIEINFKCGTNIRAILNYKE